MSNTSASLPHIDADSHCLPPNATLADVISFHNKFMKEVAQYEADFKASMHQIAQEQIQLKTRIQALERRTSHLEVFVEAIRKKKASKSTHRHNTTPQWPVATATKSRE